MAFDKKIASFCITKIYEYIQAREAEVPLFWRISEELAKEFGVEEDEMTYDAGYITTLPSKKENVVFLLLRGTQEDSEWLANIDAMQVPMDKRKPSVKVHEGMWGLYTQTGANPMNESLREQIVRLLPKSLSSEKKNRLIITGHSLGSAIATFAALDIAKNYPDLEMDVYIFGSPRAGNPAFIDHFINIAEKHTKPFALYSFFNIEDPVVALPPSVIPDLENDDQLVYYKHFDTPKLNSRKATIETIYGSIQLQKDLFDNHRYCAYYELTWNEKKKCPFAM